MRRLLLLPLFFLGCTAFGTDDPAPVEPPAPTSPEAGPPPDRADAAAVDAAQLDSAVPCGATETLSAARDALSAARDAIMTSTGQDLSVQRVCNLSVGSCLVAFALQQSRGKKIVGLKLDLPRSTSITDCNGSSCVTLRADGRLAVSHMRSDWTNDASLGARDRVGGKWGQPMFGASDVSGMPMVAQDVKKEQDVVSLALDPAKLDLLWAGEDAIAFQIRTANAAFQFVLERVIAASPPVPSLTVTYCP